ncbi:hypothetical protein ACWIW6_10715 [Ursidibacter sp. B-7004-1]
MAFISYRPTPNGYGCSTLANGANQLHRSQAFQHSLSEEKR